MTLVGTAPRACLSLKNPVIPGEQAILESRLILDSLGNDGSPAAGQRVWALHTRPLVLGDEGPSRSAELWETKLEGVAFAQMEACLSKSPPADTCSPPSQYISF